MAAVTGVATPCNRSCFPIMSFLHVPGKMSQPLWLMMGTAFLVRVPGGVHLGGPTFNDSAYAGNLNCGTRRVLLTAKHTFVPWKYTDPQKLKIPEEFRKTRFVIGRLYLPDDEGRAVGSRTVDLQLMALHPSLDIALVAVRPTSPPLQGLPAGCGHATV
uniref:Uncharacterized protein TCIL3000_2_1500 n=1 Tax=Trypanosoma congolense (strain IL3000) TaxID=1068625 RepID=G0UJL9_TRYCI|nr:unnamed protein product [Trypanosoma congolense IL3000]